MVENKKTVHVAVGVIVKHGQILLAKRASHQHQGGLWEFPGGKVEAGETVQNALARELNEELAIDVKACRPLLEIKHDYKDKSVFLDVWLVLEFDGEAKGIEGQPLVWAPITALANYEFPEANVEIVTYLQQHQARLAEI